MRSQMGGSSWAGSEACRFSDSHPDPSLVYLIQPVSKSCWFHIQDSSESEDFLPSLLPPPWSEPLAPPACITTLIS